MGLVERIADPDDPLRTDLETARAWHVAPTLFLGERTTGPAWTVQDSQYARALTLYESRLCPRGHDTTLSMLKEHTWDWRVPTIGPCHACHAADLEAKRWADHEHGPSMLYGAAHLADDCKYCQPPE